MGEWKCFMCLVCSEIIPYVLKHHIEPGDLQGHRLILRYTVLAKIFMWIFPYRKIFQHYHCMCTSMHMSVHTYTHTHITCFRTASLSSIQFNVLRYLKPPNLDHAIPSAGDSFPPLLPVCWSFWIILTCPSRMSSLNANRFPQASLRSSGSLKRFSLIIFSYSTAMIDFLPHVIFSVLSILKARAAQCLAFNMYQMRWCWRMRGYGWRFRKTFQVLLEWGTASPQEEKNVIRELIKLLGIVH